MLIDLGRVLFSALGILVGLIIGLRYVAKNCHKIANLEQKTEATELAGTLLSIYVSELVMRSVVYDSILLRVISG